MIICSLCAGSEPFACPFKFRRSYMLVHLEKAHDLPVKDLEFVRTFEGNDRKAVWMGRLKGRSRKTLIEAEIHVPEPDSDSPPDNGSGNGGQITAGEARTKVDGKNTTEESWTPEAMQRLYSGRGVHPA